MTTAATRILVGLLTMFFVASCQQKAADTVKIGFSTWPAYEYLYLAQEQNYFKELGVPIKLIEYASLSDVRRGYERGKLEGMASTLVELLQVKAFSKRDPRIILALDYSNGGDVVIAQKNIKTIADLKGRRVGADTTSLPLYVLARALEQAQLKVTDVEVVNSAHLTLIETYKQGKLDAIVTYSPYSQEILKLNDCHIVFSSKSIQNEIVDVLSIEQSVIHAHPEYVDKIKQAWQKSLKFSQQNPDAAMRIMAGREKISPTEFKANLDSMVLIDLEHQQDILSGIP